MSPNPLLFLILLLVVVVIATSSLAVHKILSNMLFHSLKKDGEEIIGNIIGNSQISKIEPSLIGIEKSIFSPTKVSRNYFYQKSIGLTLAMQNHKFPSNYP